MPTKFDVGTVYFNVSQDGQGEFRFNAAVTVGVYSLTADRTILVACEQECYQLIAVQISAENATVIHNGDGKIQEVGTQNQASNEPMTLKCPNSSTTCTVTLNATLSYWGSMEVSYEANLASEVTWKTKTVTLPTGTNEKRFFYM